MPDKANLNGIAFLPVNMDGALKAVMESITHKNGQYFCFINIHVAMEAERNHEFKKVLKDSAGNFPDGMGVAWALKFLGNPFEGRVRGADFLLRFCFHAAEKGYKIFLYGNTEDTLDVLKAKLRSLFPKIKIVGSISPPFREITKEEDEDYICQINESGADIVFVSLGAPKQEQWMAKHQDRIKAVQLGVGAAFSFITGKVKEAPTWMQKSYLEWLYRLPQQPGKTVYRMSLVPEFVLRLLLQALRKKN
jgi:N-acetylglucosaminyldiphosphoundecaprenol N-acetyl-beta-D-mannosaminyltransferase